MPQTAATHSVQFTNANNNVDFDVHAFNTNTGISNTFAFSDVFYQKGFEDSQSDAKAQIEHVIDDFQGMFKLNVPYMGLDSATLDGANIRYFINENAWPTVPFSQAVVQTNNISSNAVDQTIGKDMLRYMVEKISGGTNMLGLFKNQKSILDELNGVANNTINNNITTSLNSISNTILTDSDYTADANSPTYYVSSTDNATIAYNPLRILSSTILGDGDLDNDGASDLNNNARREVLLASLLNQINAHNTLMQTKEFHAVTAESDENTGNTDVQYRVFLTEAAFDAAYPQATHPQTYAQKQVHDGSVFNARLAGVDFWGFRVSAVSGTNEALNNSQVSLLDNLVNKLYNFSFQDGDSLNLIVEYNPVDSPIGFVAGQGAGGADTISQVLTNIPVRKYEIKILLKLSPDTSVLQINDPADATLKNVVDTGSNNYLVNQFNEVVSPGSVNTGLSNIFSLIVARMIDSGNAETFSGNLKDFSASDYSNANDVVTDLYVLDADGSHYPVKIGYINNSVDKYFAAVYSKAGSIVVLHAVSSDGTNNSFPAFASGGGDYQVTNLDGDNKPVWSMFNVLEQTPLAHVADQNNLAAAAKVIQLNGSNYQLNGHDLFILKGGAYLPHEIRTQYKTSNNNSVVLSGGETLFMNKNGSYEKLNNGAYEYVAVLGNSHRDALHTIFSVGQSAVQLNVNNATVSVYIDYDGNHSAVQKNNGMVFAKKTGEVKLLHVSSNSGNTADMNILLREEDVVAINENTNFQIAGNTLKNISEVVIQPVGMVNVTASMIVPSSNSVDLVGTGVDAASSETLKIDSNNQLVSRNGFVKANNVNSLLSMNLVNGVTNSYTNNGSSLEVIKKHFGLQHAGSSGVFLHDGNDNRTDVNGGLETFNIGQYSSQLQLSLNDVNVHTVLNIGNNQASVMAVHSVVLSAVPSSIITNTIHLVAVGVNDGNVFKVFNDGNSYSEGVNGSLVAMDATRFDAAGKLRAVHAGNYANIYVVNTGSVDSSLFVSNSAGVYQLLSHNATTLITQSNLNNIGDSNAQLVTNVYVDDFTTAFVNGNEMKVDANVDANSTVYRPFNTHISTANVNHGLYTYTSTSSIVIDIDPAANVSSPVDGYDYLWVTWSNGSVERMNKANASGIRVKILVEAYYDAEVNGIHGANSSLYVEKDGGARQLFVPNADGVAYAELTAGDVYYYNANTTYTKLLDNNHVSKYYAYPAANEYSKLIGKNQVYWELRKSNNVRYDMGEPLSTALRIPGDLAKSLTTANLGTLYAYITSVNFVRSFGNGQSSNETENLLLDVESDLFYVNGGAWVTLENARTSMLQMVALTDGDYATLNAKTSVGTGFLHKNLDNGNFQAAVNGTALADVLLHAGSPYNEISGKIYSNWTGINGEQTPLRLGNGGPILVVSNHDTVNLYKQDGAAFSKVSSAGVDVPLVNLTDSAIDVILEKYRSGARLLTHGEMNLHLADGGNNTVVFDGANVPVPLTNDAANKGAWIPFYLNNGADNLFVGGNAAYFINTNLSQAADQTLYSRAANGGYFAFTQINNTSREHDVAQYNEADANEIGANLSLGKVFAKHGGLTITNSANATDYAYVKYSGHGNANALFENASFLRENSNAGTSSNDQLSSTIGGNVVVTLVAARVSVNGVTPNASHHFVFDGTNYTQMNTTYSEDVDHAAGTVTFQGKVGANDALVDYLDSAGNPILHDANTMKFLMSDNKKVYTEIGEQLFVNNENDGNGADNLYKVHNSVYTRVSLGGHDAALVSPTGLVNMFDMFIPELNKTGRAIYDNVSNSRKHLIKLADGAAFTYNTDIAQRYIEANYVEVASKNAGDARLYVPLEYTNAELVTIFQTGLGADMTGNDVSGNVFLCTPSAHAYLNDDPSSNLAVDLSSNVNHASVSKIQVLIADNDQTDVAEGKYLAIQTADANLYRVINIHEILHTVISTPSQNPRKEFAFTSLDTEPSFTISILDSSGQGGSSSGKTLTFLVGADAANAVPLLADPNA